MNKLENLAASAQSFLIVMITYIVCHGVTALIVTPIQEHFISQVTVFASLMYLPHGVRVLATWLLGWKAIVPLFLGSYISNLLFTPVYVRAITDPVVLLSIAVGAVSAFFGFALVNLFWRNIKAGKRRKMDWKWLLVVGAIASVFNSVGQSIIYSGLIVPKEAFSVFATYAAGDIIGLLVTMFALLFIFRWIRLFAEAR